MGIVLDCRANIFQQLNLGALNMCELNITLQNLVNNVQLEKNLQRQRYAVLSACIGFNKRCTFSALVIAY
jgi:hypothetical protein